MSQIIRPLSTASLAWDRFRAGLERVFAPREARPSGGAASAGGSASVIPSYDRRNAMSTLAAFPWVRVCVVAKSGDLAGLPLIAVQMRDGMEEILPDHPTVRRFRRPNPGCKGLRFRRQAVADFELTGNSYLWVDAMNLYRMNPSLTVPKVNSLGQITSWIYNGKRNIPAGNVIHVADISWSDTLEEVLGETAIRCLHTSLSADLAAKQLSAVQAKRGRPDFVLTPIDQGSSFGDRRAREYRDAYEQGAQRGDGMFVFGDAVTVQSMSWSAREQEYSRNRELTANEVLAVFQVPPVRAGVAGASYGESRQQMRVYWENLLRHEGALFDDEWSELTGDESVRIRHDSTNIEALQASYSERQMRAEKWMLSFGAAPDAAAAYEGFPDAPTGDPGSRARPAATEVVEPQESTGNRPQGPEARIARVVHAYLSGAAERADGHGVSAGDESLLALEALQESGIPVDVALAWSGEIGSLVSEAVARTRSEAADRGNEIRGLAHLDVFSAGTAARLASGIVSTLD